MNPKISIIVPIYQVEKYIRNSMISISNQTFTDFEVILVDDGTKDNSIQIAEEVLKSKNITYKVFYQNNQGTSVARNTGIDQSHGEWIAFIDPDDVIQNDYLKILYDSAIFHDICVSLGNYQVVGINTLFLQTNLVHESRIYDQKEILDLFLVRKINIVVTAMLIKKDLILKHNLRFDPKIKYGEDAHFIWQVLFSQKKILYNKIALYNYFIRENSTSTASTVDKMLTSYYGFITLAKVISTKSNKLFAERVLARQVLALLRVSAKTMKYEDFLKLYDFINIRSYFFILLGFPDLRVKLLSLLLCFFKRRFYFLNKPWVNNKRWFHENENC